MQTLIAPTENFALGEKTFSTVDVISASTVLPVVNTTGFSVNDFIIIGFIGNETSEIRKIESIVSNVSITITHAVSFAHTTHSLITKIFYDYRKFYRSSTETGTYSHLLGEGSPSLISVDSPEGTQFDDSTGTATSWYKATYYNSVTLIETSLADSIASQAGEGASYTTIYKIRQEAGFENNDYISSELIGRYRDEAQMEVDGALAITYATPFSPVPKLVTHITTLLAAGLLLSKEYGVEADVEVSKTGQRKIERAEELLAKLKNGDLLLTASDGSTLGKNSTMLASGSNSYSSDGISKGDLFNLNDENFRFTNPAEPLSASSRIAGTLRTR